MPFVDPVSFADAIRLVVHLAPRRFAGEVVLDATAEGVTLEYLGASQRVAWLDGADVFTVRASADQLRRLAATLGGARPLVLAVEGADLRVGTTVLRCAPAERPPADEGLPVQPSLSQVLAFAMGHSAAHIEALGLAPVVRAAERDRDARLRRALEALRPLGVTETGLRAVVDAAIRANA
jgi:hypothetical protein